MSKIKKDHIRRWAGAATKDAVPDTGQVAERIGRTDRTVQRYKAGDRSAPLNKYLEWLEKLDRPFREAAHVMAYIKYRTVHQKPTRELVERWVELTDLEHDLEAEENREIADGLGCVDAEILADEREAAIQLERAAVRRELHIRGVNPRSFRRDR